MKLSNHNNQLACYRLPASLLFSALLLLLPTTANASKILRTAFPTQETGFDPARVSDLYSATVIDAIFDHLLTYDYLASPPRLAPQAASAMPVISADKKTYTFTLPSDRYFAQDIAFGSKKRALTAADFVYSFKRHLDPKIRSPWAFMLDNKIIGLNELAEQAKKTGKFDYDAPISGFETPNPQTLIIHLKQPDPNFLFIMAHSQMAAVAREVIEYYQDSQAHPVGSGPYQLSEWLRGNKIILTKNPNFKSFVWNFTARKNEADQALVKRMHGRLMPAIDKVEVSIIEEPQSIWLAFLQAQLDITGIPAPFRSQVFDAQGKIRPAFSKYGHQSVTSPEITYTFFNQRDPIVGGEALEKVALRRAIAMAYNTQDEIQQIRKGQAVRAQSIAPAGVQGYDPNYKSSINYDPDLANKLLDYFHYTPGADGWRRRPDGQALIIRMSSSPGSASREFNELWKKAFDKLHIQVEFINTNFSDNIKAANACQLMMWGAAWGADYPDADNFYQLLYGKNIGISNSACYASKEYDRIYEQTLRMENGPERNTLFRELDRQIEADTPWILGVSRLGDVLIQPGILGYKRHPVLNAIWMYMDIEK